jgi:hypothetical protein
MADPEVGDVFVMGGTGMLAPAVHWLALRAGSVTLASRTPHDLAQDTGATALTLDWNSGALARRTLAARAGRYDMAIIWLHDEASALARPVENVVKKGGRVIRVHGSLAADPVIRRLRDPDPRSDVGRQVVILGYHPDDTGVEGKRWLSDIEISGGVIAAVRDPDLKALTVGAASGA